MLWMDGSWMKKVADGLWDISKWFATLKRQVYWITITLLLAGSITGFRKLYVYKKVEENTWSISSAWVKIICLVDEDREYNYDEMALVMFSGVDRNGFFKSDGFSVLKPTAKRPTLIPCQYFQLPLYGITVVYIFRTGLNGPDQTEGIICDCLCKNPPC